VTRHFPTCFGSRKLLFKLFCISPDGPEVYCLSGLDTASVRTDAVPASRQKRPLVLSLVFYSILESYIVKKQRARSGWFSRFKFHEKVIDAFSWGVRLSIYYMTTCSSQSMATNLTLLLGLQTVNAQGTIASGQPAVLRVSEQLEVARGGALESCHVK
jgi:hypothetical protein